MQNSNRSSLSGKTNVTRRSAPAPEANIPEWFDWLVLIVVFGIAAVSIAVTLLSGGLTTSLLNDATWSWHLVRAAGLVAYALLAASTLWGFLLHTRLIRDWSPGPLSLLLHAATSWLAVVFAFAHMALLMFDKFYTYTIPDLIVPFIGPYRPFAVGIGVLAFWLTFAITISFSMRKLIGQKAWRWLHLTSYITFLMVTVHALLAGTDASRLGMEITLLGSGFVVVTLTVYRIWLAINPPKAANKAK